MDLVKSQMADTVVDQLTQQLGGAEREKTAAATEGIINVLMGAMARNAATPDGAAALNRALEQDHDGSVLDNLGDILGGNTAPVSDRALNGSGILKHVLGDRQGSAIDMISKMSGLDSNKAGNLMATLAPVVMGMLGKAKRQNNLDQSGISDLLGGFAKQQQSSGSPMASLLTGFLDADGDGSIVDDVAGMLGKGLLGGLFKRR